MSANNDMPVSYHATDKPGQLQRSANAQVPWEAVASDVLA